VGDHDNRETNLSMDRQDCFDYLVTLTSSELARWFIDKEQSRQNRYSCHQRNALTFTDGHLMNRTVR
jgi:hypothetical protein